jgi:hypothetical protein
LLIPIPCGKGGFAVLVDFVVVFDAVDGSDNETGGSVILVGDSANRVVALVDSFHFLSPFHLTVTAEAVSSHFSATRQTV